MGDIADMLASYYVRTVALEERSRRLMAEVLPALDPDQEGEKCGACVYYTVHVLREDARYSCIPCVRSQLSE